jgi:ubiquinone/menaquinone biosynthesis C-methylase UbiE
MPRTHAVRDNAVRSERSISGSHRVLREKKLMTVSNSYRLGYTEDEARRLEEQAALFEDLTEDVLRRAGIGARMQVLDVGCGVGDVSFLAARLVGPHGTVLGIDRNASSVELARQRCALLGIQNVQFETAEIDAFDTAKSFDAVVGRLVLIFLPDPAATLQRFRNFLRPNGIIAFQETDIEQVSQTPASELFNQVRSWIHSAFKAGGAELNMGSKLPPVFLNAGLPRPTMIAASRVESGPDSRGYSYIAQTVRSLLPLLERAGAATSEEIAIDTLAERLRQDAVETERVTFLPRMVGAWARVP